MSFQYTKATLKAALLLFNDDDNAELVAALDDLIRLGESRLYKRLDLDALDAIGNAVTVAASAEVSKPDNLVVDRLIVLNNGGEKSFVHRRSRAWLEQYNVDDEQDVPKYYSDLDENRWIVGPLASQEFELLIHGLYRPVSLVDGADDGTTWFSTRVPELLLAACSIEVCEFRKFWSKKAAQEAAFEEQAALWLKIAAPLQRSDVEDIVGNRQNENKSDTQAG